MLEPDVALTDFALAAQCALFAALLLGRREGPRGLRRSFAALFAALGAAALFGGLWHGLFSGAATAAGDGVWLVTLAALALAAAALWLVAAALLPPGPWPVRLRGVAFVQFLLQMLIAAFVTDAFIVAAAGMLPGLAAVAALYLRQYQKAPAPRLALGLGGLVLAALSGLVIVFGISLNPRWGTPNALYHVLQFVAFWLIFRSVPALRVYPR